MMVLNSKRPSHDYRVDNMIPNTLEALSEEAIMG